MFDVAVVYQVANTGSLRFQALGCKALKEGTCSKFFHQQIDFFYMIILIYKEIHIKKNLINVTRASKTELALLAHHVFST